MSGAVVVRGRRREVTDSSTLAHLHPGQAGQAQQDRYNLLKGYVMCGVVYEV